MQDMDAVYRQHFRMVYQYLMSLTHQPDVAEELAQETFCQAVSSSECGSWGAGPPPSGRPCASGHWW